MGLSWANEFKEDGELVSLTVPTIDEQVAAYQLYRLSWH